MLDFTKLPEDFLLLQSAEQEDYRVASNVLEPVLFLMRENNKYRVRLGAKLIKRGFESTMFAPSLNCNWVVRDKLIHPLPRDVRKSVQNVLADCNPEDLTFPELIAIMRVEGPAIGIETDPSVFAVSDEPMELPDGHLDIPGLEAKLYPYQERGVLWMKEALSRTGGVILADEMGLGKTIQIISLLLLEPPSESSPALIICPTTLIANWVRELSRFAPSLSVQVHRGAYRSRLHRYLQQTQVVISTYDTVVNDLVLFKAIDWSYVILDEAQALKNPDAIRRVAIAELPRQKTIPVTGTPVENHLLDLWSLADIAIPGLLGSRDWFESNFPDTEPAARSLAEMTNPVVLKRQVRDVAKDLPDRLDIEVPIELGRTLAREYDRVLDETLAKHPEAGPLVATGQLQLFCAHPWLQTSDPSVSGWEDRITIARQSGIPLITPKLERAIDLLSEAFSLHKKVLIFANFNACNILFAEAAEKLPKAFWGAINGSTPAEERQAIVDDFSNFNGPAVLVLNPRAAGAGLNITAATVVIHYTQVWNPAIEQQASARAHRRGQTEPVTIYHMFYVNTVEEVMMERAQRRRELGAEAISISGDEKTDLERAMSMRPEIK